MTNAFLKYMSHPLSIQQLVQRVRAEMARDPYIPRGLPTMDYTDTLTWALDWGFNYWSTAVMSKLPDAIIEIVKAIDTETCNALDLSNTGLSAQHREPLWEVFKRFAEVVELNMSGNDLGVALGALSPTLKILKLSGCNLGDEKQEICNTTDFGATFAAYNPSGVSNCITVDGAGLPGQCGKEIQGKYYLEPTQWDGRACWRQPFTQDRFTGKTGRAAHYIFWHSGSKRWFMHDRLGGEGGLAYIQQDTQAPPQGVAWNVANIEARKWEASPETIVTAGDDCELVHRLVGLLGMLLNWDMQQLDLSNNGLKDAMVTQFVKPLRLCTNLTLFDFGGNAMNPVEPYDKGTPGELLVKMLTNSPNLQTLRLNKVPLNNEFASVFGPSDLLHLTAAVYKLPTNKDGWVEGGRLTQLSRSCPGITTLDLSATGASFAMLRHWLPPWTGGLRSLNVSTCEGATNITLHGVLKKCSQLQELWIEGNALETAGLHKLLGVNSGYPPGWQCFPRSLRRLYAAGNRWKAEDIFTIQERYPDLEILSESMRASELMKAVNAATKELQLAAKGLVVADLKLLAALLQSGCDGIEVISVGHNPCGAGGLTNTGLLESMARLPRLRRLSIVGMGLDDTSFEAVTRAITPNTQEEELLGRQSFPSLEYLELYYNSISASGQEKLWTAWCASGRRDQDLALSSANTQQ